MEQPRKLKWLLGLWVHNDIGVPQEYAKGTIRVSFGRDNMVEDAEAVAKAIENIYCCAQTISP